MIAALNTKILLVIAAILAAIGADLAIEHHRAEVARQKAEAARQAPERENKRFWDSVDKKRREQNVQWGGDAAGAIQNWRLDGPGPTPKAKPKAIPQ